MNDHVTTRTALLAGCVVMAASVFSLPPEARGGLQWALSQALTNQGMDPTTYGLPPLSLQAPAIEPVPPATQAMPSEPSFVWGFREVQTPQSGPALNGFVSQELWIDTPDRWLSAQIRIELDEGTIFQRQYGGQDFTVGGINPILIAEEPSFALDTHVGLTGGDVFAVGGAINLGGTPRPRTGDAVFDIAWAATPGKIATGHLSLGRFTLSDNASGRAAVLLSDGEIFTHRVDIDQGRLLVGERILHGLDADFQPLPPPPPPPPPLLLRGMTAEQTALCIGAAYDVYNCLPVSSDSQQSNPGLTGTPAPEPRTWALALVLVLACWGLAIGARPQPR